MTTPEERAELHKFVEQAVENSPLAPHVRPEFRDEDGQINSTLIVARLYTICVETITEMARDSESQETKDKAAELLRIAAAGEYSNFRLVLSCMTNDLTYTIMSTRIERELFIPFENTEVQ